MPISRDARTDRRRRLLRDTTEMETGDSPAQRRNASRPTEIEDFDGTMPKRKAGYSQDVRKACGQRLVQLIPVRRRSFAGVVLISLLIPALLLTAHYMIHVSGQLQWWRHPLAIALDIGHPRSIAAWLCSQLWLLCLAATVLTFQLRRHKLDDYNGEYRLWFWLVLTCLIASVDATTSVTSLFALALDPWAQTRLGWSGPAVVDSTMAVLIGMLGLRMCGELKSVPLSLVCWLLGLVLWSGSAALARPEFLLEMSAPIRYWLTAALWISGLTMIWLAALTYLRNIYIEAQRRFLLRGHLASSGIPLRQRLRESLPNMPQFRRNSQSANGANETAAADSDQRRNSRWSLLGFMRPRGQDLNAEVATDSPKRSARSRKQTKVQQAIVTEQRELPGKPTKLPTTEGAQTGHAQSDRHEAPRQERPAASPLRNDIVAPDQPAETSARRGLGGFLKSSRAVASSTSASQAQDANGGKSSPANSPPKSRFGGWLRRGKHSDDAEEFRKVTSGKNNKVENSSTHEQHPPSRTEQQSPRSTADTSSTESAPRTARRWLPKLSRPKLPMPSLPRPKLAFPKFSRSKSATPSQLKSEKKSLLSRFKLPSFSLSALKLQPPDDAQVSSGTAQPAREMRPVAAATRPLPGTTPVADQDEYFDEEDNDGRPLSKAERKRLRRNQQQRRSA